MLKDRNEVWDEIIYPSSIINGYTKDFTSNTLWWM